MSSRISIGMTAGAFVLLLAVSSSAFAQVGYAWANQPSAANYNPDPLYAYNSARGSIGIRRNGVGKYTVRFGRLGGKGKGGGHVQVTAYGGGGATCKVGRWNYKRPDFVVQITCRKADGRHADSHYTVLAGWPRPGGSVTGIKRVRKKKLPRRGGGGGGDKADDASVSDATALADMINILYGQVEEIRRELNKLAQ